MFADSDILRSVPAARSARFTALLVERLGATAASRIYNGAVDGLTAAAFHDHCDARPNTVTLIQDTRGNVFGGYTDVSWYSKGGYSRSESSFLFSVVNPFGDDVTLFPINPSGKTSKLTWLCSLFRLAGPGIPGVHCCDALLIFSVQVAFICLLD